MKIGLRYKDNGQAERNVTRTDSKIGKRIVILLVIAGLMLVPVMVNAGEEDQILRDYGAYLLQTHPEIQSMSNVEKAKFAFTEYMNRLDQAGAGNDDNMVTRVDSFITGMFSDNVGFTCSQHTLNLEAMFEGMGIENFGMIEASKNYYNPLNWDVNINHGAVVVMGENGQPYVFDAWAHARERRYTDLDNVVDQDLYGDAENSPWNGMPIDGWGMFMEDDLYTSYLYVPYEGIDGNYMPDPREAVDFVILRDYPTPPDEPISPDEPDIIPDDPTSPDGPSPLPDEPDIVTDDPIPPPDGPSPLPDDPDIVTDDPSPLPGDPDIVTDDPIPPPDGPSPLPGDPDIITDDPTPPPDGPGTSHTFDLDWVEEDAEGHRYRVDLGMGPDGLQILATEPPCSDELMAFFNEEITRFLRDDLAGPYGSYDMEVSQYYNDDWFADMYPETVDTYNKFLEATGNDHILWYKIVSSPGFDPSDLEEYICREDEECYEEKECVGEECDDECVGEECDDDDDDECVGEECDDDPYDDDDDECVGEECDDDPYDDDDDDWLDEDSGGSSSGGGGRGYQFSDDGKMKMASPEPSGGTKAGDANKNIGGGGGGGIP